jgi:hypothetical protein
MEALLLLQQTPTQTKSGFNIQILFWLIWVLQPSATEYFRALDITEQDLAAGGTSGQILGQSNSNYTKSV